MLLSAARVGEPLPELGFVYNGVRRIGSLPFLSFSAVSFLLGIMLSAKITPENNAGPGSEQRIHDALEKVLYENQARPLLAGRSLMVDWQPAVTRGRYNRRRPPTSGSSPQTVTRALTGKGGGLE